MTRILAMCFSIMFLTACENGQFAPTDAERKVIKEVQKKRGDARLKEFGACMELAAKLPRQSDDDVAEIVEECRSSSYYLTNYIE